MDEINQNPEQIARDNIDRMLIAAGWAVQNKTEINWNAGCGNLFQPGVLSTGDCFVPRNDKIAILSLK